MILNIDFYGIISSKDIGSAKELSDFITDYCRRNNWEFSQVVYGGKGYTLEQLGELYPRLSEYTTIHVMTVPIWDKQQLFFQYINSDISKISNIKPVATVPSAMGRSPLQENYKRLSPQDRADLLARLNRFLEKKTGLSIDLAEAKGNGYLFYSRHYLSILAYLAGMSLERVVEICFDWDIGKNYMDIIHIAFADFLVNDYDSPLTEQGLRLYDNYIDAVIQPPIVERAFPPIPPVPQYNPGPPLPLPPVDLARRFD
jgi:hypothetical protein